WVVGIRPVGQENIDQFVGGICPGSSAGKTIMSKGFRAGKMANVALVIRYIQALHIKSYGSPFVSGMSGCEFSDCGWSKNFFSSIAAFIDQHLKKYCQVQAIGKQSCMSTYP